MAQSDHHDQPAPRYEETDAPQNPPNSVLRPAARTGALTVYVGGIIALFVIVGAALLVRSGISHLGDTEIERPDDALVGTSGRGTAEEPGLGGFNPTPTPGSTRDEIELRGELEPVPGPAANASATGEPLNELGSLFDGAPAAVVGRRIELRDVNVERPIENQMLWVRDGDARAEVIAPAGTGEVRVDQRVSVRGLVEPDGKGGVRIRATEVTVQ
jgi:hypothetical protein